MGGHADRVVERSGDVGIWDGSGMLAIMPSAFDVGEEVLARATGVPVGQ
jgi:hypothetical protein